MGNSKRPPKKNQKFIQFLDKKDLTIDNNLLSYLLLSSAIKQDFIEHEYDNVAFVGKSKKNTDNTIHRNKYVSPNTLPSQSLYIIDKTGGICTKDVNELSNNFFYQEHSTSNWNLSIPVPESIYSLWKKNHEITIFENKQIEPKLPLPKVFIDISLNSIGDILDIIENYEDNGKVEYNIDVHSLHNIKTELLELNNMVGMNSLKTSLLDQLIYFMQNLHIGKGISDYKHIVIYGSPGTGKTEIAKIIGKMYSKLGILQNNIFKKVTRNDLIAGYLGQTALKTKKVIEECIGGVLFIDEAYSLANSDNNDSYSKECLDILCESLSDHKNNLMVIIAGYEEELNNTFFKINQGLNSRFIWRFTMEPYVAGELMSIFKKMIYDQEWELLNMSTLTERWFVDKMDNFKNYGRDMELLLTYSKIAHGRRIYGKDSSIRKKLSMEDINNGYQTLIKNKKQKEMPSYLNGIYV
jgi:chromosomal replication initiation ATPase DnaA